MSPAPTTLIRRSTTPVEATVGEEVVLMSLSRGECVGLGDTASDVWRLLAEPTTFSTLTTRLRDLYEAPEGIIEQDTAELLDQMKRHALVDF